jgi:hypothetical protein
LDGPFVGLGVAVAVWPGAGKELSPARVGRCADDEVRPTLLPVAGDLEWMTYADAAPAIGCSRPTIARMVKAGAIRSKEQAWRHLPSSWRADVERVAVEWAQERREAEVRRRSRPASAAPDDGEVWLSVADAALVMGLSRNGVLYRVDRGLVPHVRRGVRVWLRRGHVEQAAAARAFQRRARGE